MDIQTYFSEVEDFRIEKKCHHRLSDILLIGLFTYLSNGEDYEDMVLFGQTHKDALTDYLDLPNGIPSHDTFNRVFTNIEPDVLRRCLNDYGKDMVGILSEKQLCIDGKKLKGVSPKSKGNHGLYIVNAWVSENRICVGQKKVEEKSNEIKAIPELLNDLDITDAIVSIDAMGCQKEIVSQIVEKQGHYLIAVKSNQASLFEDVVCGFKANTPISMSEQWEYERGRFENRVCSILDARDTLLDENLVEWKNLKTLIKVESTRTFTDRKSTEVRYYISDQEHINAAYFNALVRGHWSIENHLHWHLDITFNEDSSRVRTGYAPENLATMRKFALQIIENYQDKLSLKKRRVKAAYDVEYLKKMIRHYPTKCVSGFSLDFKSVFKYC